MLRIIRKYRTVLRFILTFMGTYFLLVLLYQLYLNYYHSKGLTDYITNLVARQTEALITSFGYNSSVTASSDYPLMELYVNGEFIARIIEGCNSVSLVILFLAFTLSFFGKFKPSLLYIFAGIAIIYSMNVIRIALLSIGIYEIPDQAHLFHEILFPLIIYGTVFLLWLIWIVIFSKKVYK